MKGLVYKEFYLGKKPLWAYGIVIFMFAFLGVLVCISMDYGNLKEFVVNYKTRSYYAKIFFYVPYVIFLLSTEVCVGSIIRDCSTSWMEYGYTLPVSAKKTIGAKYISFGIILLAGLAFGVLNGTLIGTLSGVAYSYEILKKQIIILAMVCAQNAMLIAIAYRVRTIQKMYFIIIALGCIVIVPLCMILIWGVNKYGVDGEGYVVFYRILSEKINEIWKFIAPITPIMLVIWLALWFYVATRIYQRRENA